MKVVILAGGLGSRLGEFTDVMPKPMVAIGGKPIIWHIMQAFSAYGHNEFFVALGYKGEMLKQYFSDYHQRNSDFRVDLSNGRVEFLNKNPVPWSVNLIDTGLNTMTGGRLRRLRQYVESEPFLLTYGDGIANVNIQNLIDNHVKSGKMVTVTAVRPAARFGELEIDGNKVLSFTEKPQINQGWINGGFMVLEPDFLNFIEDDQTILEGFPLSEVARLGQLNSYKHEGFWQCMDTKRDYEMLNELAQSAEVWPWSHE